MSIYPGNCPNISFSSVLADLEGSQPEGEERTDGGPGRQQWLWEEHHCPAAAEALRPHRGYGKWEEPSSPAGEAGHKLALDIVFLQINPCVHLSLARAHSVATHWDKAHISGHGANASSESLETTGTRQDSSVTKYCSQLSLS